MTGCGIPEVTALLKFIGSAILIYAAYCGLLFFVQRQVIFPRYMIPSPAPMDLGAAGIEPAWLDTSFGKVEAWYIPPARPRSFSDTATAS